MPNFNGAQLCSIEFSKWILAQHWPHFSFLKSGARALCRCSDSADAKCCSESVVSTCAYVCVRVVQFTHVCVSQIHWQHTVYVYIDGAVHKIVAASPLVEFCTHTCNATNHRHCSIDLWHSRVSHDHFYI